MERKKIKFDLIKLVLRKSIVLIVQVGVVNFTDSPIRLRTIDYQFIVDLY